MNEKLIAVVDDERDIRDLVTLHLGKAGFETVSFESGGDFLLWLDKGGCPSLCVLDIMLPDLQGTDVCRKMQRIEEYSSIPIIMLTALGHETDRVTGLELGADDYVTKPFSPRELVARVRAVLRRSSGAPGGGRDSIAVLGPVRMNFETYSVTVNGEEAGLTSTEFRILEILIRHPEKVFSRSSLLEQLWGGEKFVFERTIDVHIRHIREKLKDASRMIQNVRGIGYKIGESQG